MVWGSRTGEPFSVVGLEHVVKNNVAVLRACGIERKRRASCPISKPFPLVPLPSIEHLVLAEAMGAHSVLAVQLLSCSGPCQG